MASEINQAIYKLVKRAEKQDLKHLVETFVDVGPLLTLLQNRDHQILYGRRGTGKTHALNYLSSDLLHKGHIPVYIDMRNIGSNGGIYSDLNLSITERATRLLIDTYAIIHDQILDYVLNNDSACDLSRFGPLLDELAKSISEIEVVGQWPRKAPEFSVAPRLRLESWSAWPSTCRHFARSARKSSREHESKAGGKNR